MPVDRRVCFVCGSLGVESKLFIKPSDRREPYFPFLENHDPPKGSRLPGKDGIVDSCRVCRSFLVSQWEAYERSRTPPIKRLYWLKRADNGHFTGAEMRLQGEYIAQVMGLQYQPFDDRNSPTGNTEPPSSPVSIPAVETRRTNISSQGNNTRVPNSKENKSKVSANSAVSESNIQSLQQLPKVEKTGPHGEGALDLSVTKKSMLSNERQRTSDIGETDGGFNCFLCLRASHIPTSKLINTSRQTRGEPYFPILKAVPQAKMSEAFNKQGQVRVCMSCKNVLYQQWQAYEMSGVAIDQRTYKLYDDANPPQFFESVSSSVGVAPKEVSISSLSQSNTHVCYLCGHVYPEGLIQPLFTVPPREPSIATLFFPFIRDLQRPQGAHPLKSDGTVLTCRKCFTELYHQWQQHKMENVPIAQRRYSLSFLSKVVSCPPVTLTTPVIKQEVDVQPEKGGPSSASSSDISQPLNIQISESSAVTSQTPPGGLQGLLTIAARGAPQSEMLQTAHYSAELNGMFH